MPLRPVICPLLVSCSSKPRGVPLAREVCPDLGDVPLACGVCQCLQMYAVCPWFVGCAPYLTGVSPAPSDIPLLPSSCGVPLPKVYAVHAWFVGCAPALRGVPLLQEVCPSLLRCTPYWRCTLVPKSVPLVLRTCPRP